MYLDDMMYHVHIDGMWSQLRTLRKRFLVSSNETAPYCHVKSKRFIPKAMFLSGIARTRYDHTRNAFLDGKLGIWTFVEVVPAKCKLKNRPAGTSDLNPVNVTGEIYKKFMIEKVLPIIRARFPIAYRSNFLYNRIMQDHT